MKPFGAITSRVDDLTDRVTRASDDMSAGVQTATETIMIIGIVAVAALLLATLAVIRVDR
jgi:hypothetical protein